MRKKIMAKSKVVKSPVWDSNTKLVVSLTLVVSLGALLVRFQEIISPLIITFMVTYIFHPIAGYLVDKLKLSWTMAVNLLFLIVIGFYTYTLTRKNQKQLEKIIRTIAIKKGKNK